MTREAVVVAPLRARGVPVNLAEHLGGRRASTT